MSRVAIISAGTETYADTGLGEGTYRYRLTAVNAAGRESAFSNEIMVIITSVVTLGDEIPETFALEQNYPNPFNPTTTITYDVAEPSDVRLLVHDLLGKAVAVLVDERHAAGRYEVAFEASGLASGVYLYTLRAGSFTQTKRLVLLK